LELGGFTMLKSAKGYKTQDTPDYANIRLTQLSTHFQQTQRDPSLRKKRKTLLHLNIFVSQEKTSGTHTFLNYDKDSLGFRKNCISTTRSMFIYWVNILGSPLHLSTSIHAHELLGIHKASKGSELLNFSRRIYASRMWTNMVFWMGITSSILLWFECFKPWHAPDIILYNVCTKDRAK